VTERLILKWGTLKGWDNISERTKAALDRYVELGISPNGAMFQRDTPEQKQALCDAIDAVEGEIYNSWSGENMTKEDAKLYIMEYETP
jgi:hypothetical protein